MKNMHDVRMSIKWEGIHAAWASAGKATQIDAGLPINLDLPLCWDTMCDHARANPAHKGAIEEQRRTHKSSKQDRLNQGQP